MSLPQSFPLKAADGKSIPMPVVGFGTFGTEENWAKDAVLTALKEGYRHLDCAWMYGVDGAVGAAIRESGIPREDIFVTSKFWGHYYHPQNVELALDQVLKGMGLDYVDLWLAHWPVAFKPISHEALTKAFCAPGLLSDENGSSVVDWEHSCEHLAKLSGQQGSFVPTLKAMQECVRKGKARTIGVSNFSVAEIQELLPHERDVPNSCNQVEVHPWLPQTELLEFCNANKIVLTCYSPFAGQKDSGEILIKDPKVLELAKKNDMDAGQLLQSWAVTRGTVPLGKSATPSRIKTNLAVRKLSDQDMKALDALEKLGDSGRTINPSKWGAKLFQNH